MPDITFTIDTDPMAASINKVTHHVEGVTTAVVAMQTAVVIAEEQAANNLCQNLNKGFYTLIRSQISQKIAKFKSETDSKWMEMRQQIGALASIQGRMERDYMMISRRYTKLFDSLNKALKSRIFELDKPTAVFVNKEIAPTANRVRMFLGTTAVNQTESISLSQLIGVSRTKFLGQRTVESMHEFLTDNKHQNHIIYSILNPGAVSEAREFYIPVILEESVHSAGGNTGLRFYLPQSQDNRLNTTLNYRIQTEVISIFNSLRWTEAGGNATQMVDSEYHSMVQNSALPSKQKEKMIKMYNSSKWASLT